MIAYNMQMSEMYKNKINLAITKIQLDINSEG